MIIEESNATLKNFEFVICSGGPGPLINKTWIDVNEVNNDTGIIAMTTKMISNTAIMVENLVEQLSAKKENLAKCTNKEHKCLHLSIRSMLVYNAIN